ncbi:MAG: arylesterase [Leptothrix sp. (in: b-proteobacteria)]
MVDFSLTRTSRPAVLNRRECIALALPALCAGLLAATSASSAQAASTVRPHTLLVVGDSLSAEYGLARGSGWVALLATRLAARQPPVEVINASISGDTTAGGRSRLAALLAQHRPSHVVIELGGNDALRGLPLAATTANLTAMAQSARAAGAAVLLVGMQVPPNYGAAYGRDFAALFGQVARQTGSALVPFLLAGIADDADAQRWFQPDRIHPLASAHPRILETVWTVLGPWLKR